jgi:hypothetical protein
MPHLLSEVHSLTPSRHTTIPCTPTLPDAGGPASKYQPTFIEQTRTKEWCCLRKRCDLGYIVIALILVININIHTSYILGNRM